MYKMQPGFSLLELMIVLTLIAILSLISYPLYNEHMIRVRRIYMTATLLDMASSMEKYRILHGTYDDANTANLLVDESRYNKHYKLDIKQDKNSYLLQAFPIGTQEKDLCGALSLDQEGNKTTSGSEDVMRCWS